MPDVPDLAALREVIDLMYVRGFNGRHREVIVRETRALITENERLREIERLARFLVEDPEVEAGWLPWCDDDTCANSACVATKALRVALAGYLDVASRGPGDDRNEPIA